MPLLRECILTIGIRTYSHFNSVVIKIQGSSIPDNIINRYCWIMSTFTLPKYFEGKPGKEVMYHGVGN